MYKLVLVPRTLHILRTAVGKSSLSMYTHTHSTYSTYSTRYEARCVLISTYVLCTMYICTVVLLWRNYTAECATLSTEREEPIDYSILVRTFVYTVYVCTSTSLYTRGTV